MNIVADMHTHSIASHHAYSTIAENCMAANQLGLFGIATTDHGPALKDGARPMFFAGMKNVLPRRMHGVYLFRGIEANILEENGKVDIPKRCKGVLEFGIASIHDECFGKGGVDRVTSAYLGALENPMVNLLGHTGTDWYKYDYETVIRRAAELGKLIEINAASFLYRLTSLPNCKKIAELCMHYGTRVMVNSDTHVAARVGMVAPALQMLEELNFPEELVVNSSVDQLAAYFQETCGLDIKGDTEE